MVSDGKDNGESEGRRIHEGQLVDLRLNDIAHGGLCVGRQSDGQVVFVRGGIPGEYVRVRITERKKRFRLAVVENVLEASPHRREHLWPAGAAGASGAADFGHISLDFQRELKGRVVATQVERIGGDALAQQLAGRDMSARSIEPDGDGGAQVPDDCAGGDGSTAEKSGTVEGRGTQEYLGIARERAHLDGGYARLDGDCADLDEDSARPAGAGWHTRTRFDVVKMETGVGMYREHSHELIPLADMPLAVRELESLDLFGNLWDRIITPGTRLHVVAPASGANVVVALARAPKGARARVNKSRREAVWVLPSRPSCSSQLDTLSGVSELAALPERIDLAATEKPYRLRERASDGHTLYEYDLSPSGFWQVHSSAPSALLSRVMRAAELAGGERVLELFAGAGLFSLPVARAIGKSGQLLTLEGSESAVADAVGNLAHYPWAHAHQSWIDAQAVRHALEQVHPELVIADPPRAGLGIATAQVIAQDRGVQRVMLVSCDPAAMARDVGVFAAAGWSIESFEVLDLFPHTHHVETVILLSRKDVYERIKFDVNVEDLQGRASSTATYSEIKAYILEKYGLKVSSLYIAQIKDKCGFEKRDNYNIGEGKSKELICPPEKEAAIMDAFRHFGMLRD
ncbi:MAG: TRAM domain-containing protein [Actinomycetaceae bacterium]|nr:TRAM domain-containing protein [Actinomycetaceae bacterium]MDY5854890.1 TRAM domain-containing protein [Arcanobacterium sp.]